ncbi:hypothetical protein PV05_02598 [Exophiala xenobiotica]|uniref:Uncharacterized protein n=1 Tax=Exophiala xenobiotica TaxID=348802 RepID=A0A0D2EQU4_9EURO|nr:uncharacterized protein PV05_02598 [Exophiala xenobiotica]KIW58048.1 hypothetical protein PV05_02598 [Exophiala xenobiotica]
MAPSHHYDLIKPSEDIKDEPDDSREPISRPWSKYVLYMLLAASTGLGAAFGVVLASSLLKPSTSTSAAANATATTTLSADITLPTTSTDYIAGEANDHDVLAGKVLECGYSFTEARSRGCVYDVMMQDWVPEPCYDSVLTERYLAQGNYTWYADGDGNIMSDEEMRKGEHTEAYMSGDYHKDHCIFSWEKLIRAMRNTRPVSQELVSYDHVLHCRHQTLGENHPDKRDGGIGVRAPTNYAKCALYSTWKKDFIPDKHSSTDK